MAKKLTNTDLQRLPVCAAEFIKQVIKKMRYRKKVQADVAAELIAHFEDELKECSTTEQKEQKAQRLIAEFGDIKLLAVLLRRAKKRCRPLWRRYLVRSSQVISIIILYIVIRVVFLTTGSANINVNYADWLNNLVKNGRAEEENAKSYYDKAAELSLEFPSEIEKKLYSCTSKGCRVNHGGMADFNDFEMEHLVKWLDGNQAAFEALRQGSEKPYYWPLYNNENSGPIQEKLILDVLKPLSKYRKVARAMNWQIRYDAYKQNITVALDNCMVLQKVGCHLEGKGLLIEQMVGIAIEAIANQSIFSVLEKADVRSDMLKELVEKFEKSYSTQRRVIDFEAEMAFWYDLVQRGFTDDGKGSGRVLKEGLPLVVKDVKSSLAGFFFWNYPDRGEIVSGIERYFQQAEELLNKTPWHLRNAGGDLEGWGRIGEDFFILRVLGPAHGRIGQLNWRTITRRRGLLMVLAILRHKKENGEFPRDLSELIKAGNIKVLPMDPYSDKPLVYRRTVDSFLLYSVGENFTDDGGEVVRDKEDKVKKWADEGDWVFWPVQD